MIACRVRQTVWAVSGTADKSPDSLVLCAICWTACIMRQKAYTFHNNGLRFALLLMLPGTPPISEFIHIIYLLEDNVNVQKREMWNDCVA